MGELSLTKHLTKYISLSKRESNNMCSDVKSNFSCLVMINKVNDIKFNILLYFQKVF